MRITAVIEMPIGDTRRRHLNKYDKKTIVDLGPMNEHIRVNDGVMPVHYGYIPETHNPSDEDEVDVLVFSRSEFNVGDSIEVEPIALITREDGDEKVVAVTPGQVASWEELDEAWRNLVLVFFGSNAPITGVRSRAEAEAYILDSKT